MTDKIHLEYSEAKPFLDWLLKQPKKVQKYVEFELTFTNYVSSHPAVVTIFSNESEIDGIDLFNAYNRISSRDD